MTYLDNTIYVIVVIIILFFLYKLQSYFSDLSNNEFIIYFTTDAFFIKLNQQEVSHIISNCEKIFLIN